MIHALKWGWRLRPQGQLSLFIGLLMITCFILAVGTTAGTYDGSLARELARDPHTVDTDTNVSAPLRVKALFASPQNEHGFFLDPVDANAESTPKPPGMASWPQPGETLLSPALASQYAVGSTSPWGVVAGTIDTPALSNPREKFFYARPQGPLPEQWGDPVDSFGVEFSAGNGDYINLPEFTAPLAFFIGIILCPGLIIVAIAAIQGKNVQYSTSVMKALGSPLGARLALAACAWLRPVAGSALVSASMIAALSTVPVPIRLVDVVTVPHDVRLYLPAMIAATVLGHFLTLIIPIVIGVAPPRRVALSRFSPYLQRIRQVSVLSSLVFLWLFITQESLHGFVLNLVFIGAIVSLGFALPTVSIWLCEAVTGAATWIRRSAATIVASRQLRYHSSLIMKALTLICLPIIALGSAQLFCLQLNAPMQRAVVTHEVLNNRVTTIDTTGMTVAEARRLSDALRPYGGITLVEDATPDQSTIMVEPDSQARDYFSLDSSIIHTRDGDQVNFETLPHFARTALEPLTYAVPNIVVTKDPWPDDRPIGRIILASPTPLDTATVGSIVTAHGAMQTSAEDQWLGGALENSRLVNWFTLFGPIALIACISVALNTMKQTITTTLHLNELRTTFNTPLRTIATVVALTIFVPGTIASLLTWIGYRSITAGFATHAGGPVVNTPMSFQLALVASGIIVTLIATITITHHATRLSKVG